MGRARILILLLAIGCALLAAWLVRGYLNQQPTTTVTVEAPPAPTVSVLVAAKDIVVGERLNALSFEWRDWPRDNVAAFMITQDARPDAIKELEGSRARSQFYLGEPISERKIVALKAGSLMSSLLPQNLRALAVRISDRTAANGFILPNDRVDVIATVRVLITDGLTSREVVFTRTLVTNVRVIAINRNISPDTDQASLTDLQTAVLELTPDQAETVVLSEAQGEISLTLRSIQETADGSNPEPKFTAAATDDTGMTKFSPRVQIDYSCLYDCLATVKGLNAPFPLTFRDRIEQPSQQR